MAITANNTTLTFNDATTQTTSGVTSVGVSTGLSSTGGKTPTLTNTGVTSLTGAGTVSLSGSTGAITITGTGGSGTVTSVATGNGLSGGTITTTGTLTVACPSQGSIGAYAFVRNNGGNISGGQTVSGSSTEFWEVNGSGEGQSAGTPSGTWRNMMSGIWLSEWITVVCRVS
jgi:hypothetical protein